MLRIKQGSIFDDKCDLLVLPCDSGGGVTPWVRSEIEQNKLPFPNTRIPFGKVMFKSTDANYPKADFIGYAASVDAVRIESNLDSISKIVLDLIKFSKLNQCTMVNLPILGTGAGRLDVSEVVDLYRKLVDDESIVFNAYIPDASTAKIFLTFSQKGENSESQDDDHPRTFISYSWKDEKIKEWVLGLAKKLCENGVDARIDRFHLRPGMDMPQWMTNEVIKAHKVLLICDEHYAEKADTRKAGVGWETMIIQGDMLLQGEMNTKYIVIACGGFDKNIPIYMKSKLGISKDDVDKDIKLLLEHIFEIDSAPEVGKVPEWIKKKRSAARS